MQIISTIRAALAVLLAMGATVTPSLADGFDHAARTGIVHLGKDGAPLFDIPPANAGIPPLLESGAAVSVVIIEPGDMQRLVQATTVGMPVSVPYDDSRLDLDGTNGDTTRYKLALTGDAELQPGAIGIGISGAANRCGTSESTASCDLEPGGAPQSFRVCASREGLHFSIWSGKPLEGTRRWRVYYFLGYDVEPDCTDRDY